MRRFQPTGQAVSNPVSVSTRHGKSHPFRSSIICPYGHYLLSGNSVSSGPRLTTTGFKRWMVLVFSPEIVVWTESFFVTVDFFIMFI